mmetsp:Transcript_12454/g.34340  ORF Transcript_12454/g.34340 Transcript_12454/m.34340 type:complete len:285 (-) Transcript_12454:218-1072(-)
MFARESAVPKSPVRRLWFLHGRSEAKELRLPERVATPAAQCSLYASASCSSLPASVLSTREPTQRTSCFEPFTQHQGSCGPQMSSAAGKPPEALRKASWSIPLCRRTASRKRKAATSLSEAFCVTCKCRNTLSRSFGLATIFVKCFLPKSSSSALRVIQKKWASLSGKWRRPSLCSRSKTAMIVDMSDSNGVTPTPAPTATKTSRESAVVVGAKYGPSKPMIGRLPESWYALMQRWASSCVQSPRPATMKSTVSSFSPEQIVNGCHCRGAYSGMQRKAYMPERK